MYQTVEDIFDSTNVILIINSNLRLDIAISVRMNSFNSETIRARTIKFGGIMHNYCLKLLFVKEFDHAHFRLSKSKKITFNLILEELCLICIIFITCFRLEINHRIYLRHNSRELIMLYRSLLTFSKLKLRVNQNCMKKQMKEN